jgi:hypothetical protein
MGNQQSSALSGDIQEKKSLIVQLSKQTIAGLDHVPLLSTAASLCMGGARARYAISPPHNEITLRTCGPDPR